MLSRSPSSSSPVMMADLPMALNVFTMERLDGSPKYLFITPNYLECFFNVSGVDTCRLLGIDLMELHRAVKWYGLLYWPYSWISGLDADETKGENDAYYRECRVQMLKTTNGKNKPLFFGLVNLWRHMHPAEQGDSESEHLLTWRDCPQSVLKPLFDDALEAKARPFKPVLTRGLLEFGNVHLPLDPSDTSDFDLLCGLYE